MPHWRFSLAVYERMIETGILAEDDRVELIRGEIVDMSPVGVRHIMSVTSLDEVLQARAGNDARILVQNPIRLPNDGVPEPDLALVHRRGYRKAPTSADTFLVIEVADSSLDYDRHTKLPLYAAAGIPEAWLFDVIADRIERHTELGPEGYQRVVVAGPGESLPSTVLASATLSIDDVLEPAE